MGNSIGPAVRKAAIDIDPDDWKDQHPGIILEAIQWRRLEASTMVTGSYELALKKQRLLREAEVLKGLLPPFSIVGASD